MAHQTSPMTALRHAIAWLGVAGLAACAAALQLALA